jgi:peptidoglycan/LPS O-acetylase OafA/YrhL/lysophospholipase L1-like esterase
LTYQPALDGVRAVAVMMVLFFHAGFEWMGGGYVGVSVFFTLSGFLITSLLVAEHAETGGVALRTFFGRRARRLLPASMLCLLLITLARLGGAFSFAPGLRSDLVSAALQIFNWTRLAGETSYAAQFTDAPQLISPVEHYWSLAIEEQFYAVWPLTLLGIFALSRRITRTSVLGITTGMFLLSAIAAPAIASAFGPDVAYWSTFSRLGELLAGAVLAVVVAHRRLPGWIARLTLPAGLALLAAAVWFPSGSGPAYSGWMPLVGIVSASCIGGLLTPSRLQTALASRVPVAIGKVSYGLYLFHWPVFVLLRQRGWELTSISGLLVALALTTAITVLSYFFLERPIRTANVEPRLTLFGASAALASLLALFLIVPSGRGFLETDSSVLAAASADGADLDAQLELATPRPTAAEVPVSTVLSAAGPVDPLAENPAPNPAPGPAPNPAPGPAQVFEAPFDTDPVLPAQLNRPVRIATIGDSTAHIVSIALARWSIDNPGYITSDVLWCPGCGFILDAEVTLFEASEPTARSNAILDDLAPALFENVRPDVVLLMVTLNDMAEHQWSLDEGPLRPQDPRFEQRMYANYLDVTQRILDEGVAQVVWVEPPTPDWLGKEDELRESERWDVMDRVIRRVVEEGAGNVHRVDMDLWLDEAGYRNNSTWRPDGTHLTDEAIDEVVDRWLVARLLQTV